ncbi:hypothetical protein Q1695_001808 [Nippostrongylus brasiliensis]|nr:hypothetical protein Q1695_001808 [Nippostrongylus brasiliensis]
MAPQFPDFRRVRRRIRRTLCYGAKQPQKINLPLSELVVDYFNKRSPFDYMKPETSASISSRGYADPCTLVVAMVYLDRLRVNDRNWFESSDPTDLYLPALVLASKFLHDSDTYDRASNAEWADAANISTQHLNQLEWEFAQKLNWNVMVDQTEFDRWLGFFEYWVANHFITKNDFCTYNEVLQLSKSLPIMNLLQAFVSYIGLMTIVYTFSVVSLFTVPCALTRSYAGTANITEPLSVLPHLTSDVPEIVFHADPQASPSNFFNSYVEEASYQATPSCETNLNSSCIETDLDFFSETCLLESLQKVNYASYFDHHFTDFSVYSLFHRVS